MNNQLGYLILFPIVCIGVAVCNPQRQHYIAYRGNEAFSSIFWNDFQPLRFKVKDN